MATLDCQECATFYVDPKTGKRSTTHGVPVRRPAWDRPPCRTCPKIPLGHPNPGPGAAEELDARGWQAWTFYEQGAAVKWNGTPVDGAVRYLAGVIRRTLRECEQLQEEVRFNRLGQALMIAKAK